MQAVKNRLVMPFSMCGAILLEIALIHAGSRHG
jgi:hypothetical protein